MNELEETVDRVADLLMTLNLDIESDTADLIGSGAMDSLVLVEFLTRLEKEMGVAIPIEELDPDHFRSVRSIASFVHATRTSQSVR